MGIAPPSLPVWALSAPYRAECGGRGNLLRELEHMSASSDRGSRTSPVYPQWLDGCSRLCRAATLRAPEREMNRSFWMRRARLRSRERTKADRLLELRADCGPVDAGHRLSPAEQRYAQVLASRKPFLPNPGRWWPTGPLHTINLGVYFLHW